VGQAQRRFRERQKAKFTELTGKVEELEGRLSELLSEKARLEDRTSILEKTLEMRRGSSLDTDEVFAGRLNSVVSSELCICSEEGLQST
jgi:predicted nuclease with TOPRIM domain